MKSKLRNIICLTFIFALAGCGGNSDNHESDSSYSGSYISGSGAVYQCDTEDAYNSCSDDGADCSACTCTDKCTTDTTDTDDSSGSKECEANGREITVPNNGSCTFNGETATCTNGSINFLFFTSGGGQISLENSNINGKIYDGILSCSD